MYFSYRNGTNTGRWVGTTRGGGSATNVNSSIAISTSYRYKLKPIIDALGNNDNFYIDGVLVGSSAIPTTDLKFVFGIQKTIGRTSRTASIDSISWQMIRQFK